MAFNVAHISLECDWNAPKPRKRYTNDMVFLFTRRRRGRRKPGRPPTARPGPVRRAARTAAAAAVIVPIESVGVGETKCRISGHLINHAIATSNVRKII